MKVFELFREIGLSREDVELRVRNSKSPQEKAVWQSMMPPERLRLSEEKLADYFNRLKTKEKIKHLGGGAFSQVFQHPEFENVVVKIYVQRDKLYAKYAKFCLANQSNPFVPQIIEQSAHRSPSGDKYNILFMQKMTPIKTTQKLSLELTKVLKLNGDEEREIYEYVDEYRLTNLFRMISLAVIQNDVDKDFAKLWKFIKAQGVDNFDLHEGNAMMRGSQLVITDPTASDPGDERIDEL